MFRAVYERLKRQGVSFPSYTEEFAYKQLRRLVNLRGCLFEGDFETAGELYTQVSADADCLACLRHASNPPDQVEQVLQLINSTLSLYEILSQRKLPPVSICETSMVGSDISVDLELDTQVAAERALVTLQQAHNDLEN